MPTFFMFGKYSAESLPKISSDRTQKASSVIQDQGGEIKSIHALLGSPDLVLQVELPGVQQAMQASVSLTKLTGIAFSTCPAVEVSEFDELIAKLARS